MEISKPSVGPQHPHISYLNNDCSYTHGNFCCRHTTSAFSSDHRLPQTVPHVWLMYTSSRPSLPSLPPASRTGTLDFMARLSGNAEVVEIEGVLVAWASASVEVKGVTVVETVVVVARVVVRGVLVVGGRVAGTGPHTSFTSSACMHECILEKIQSEMFVSFPLHAILEGNTSNSEAM